MDPALPLFITALPDDKLDPTDAEFVDVYHSNAFVQGQIERCGTVDFYMNGGIGIDWHAFSSKITFLINFLSPYSSSTRNQFISFHLHCNHHTISTPIAVQPGCFSFGSSEYHLINHQRELQSVKNYVFYRFASVLLSNAPKTYCNSDKLYRTFTNYFERKNKRLDFWCNLVFHRKFAIWRDMIALHTQFDMNARINISSFGKLKTWKCVYN